MKARVIVMVILELLHIGGVAMIFGLFTIHLYRMWTTFFSLHIWAFGGESVL
ncbi:hypothetical protein [Gracilibacillus sp. JCM 18860]|uniref:hypothetical protein n=1 Tax=Gracilibacillus sp. JCM 18860 TaxID=1306159 RepID=UPI003260D602